jgi:hypothetical protein
MGIGNRAISAKKIDDKMARKMIIANKFDLI